MHKHLKRDMIRLAGRLETLEAVVRLLLLKAVETVSGGPDAGEPPDFSGKRLELDEAAANVDEECLKIIALHQPDEDTLRHLAGTIKVANDLKKAGETAANLVMRLAGMRSDPSEGFSADDAGMADEVLSIFDRAFAAFINLDDKEAGAIADLKSGIRESVQKANHEAESAFHSCAEASSPMIRRLHVLGQLEMISDNCVNICLVTAGLAERKVPASMKPEEAL